MFNKFECVNSSIFYKDKKHYGGTKKKEKYIVDNGKRGKNERYAEYVKT